MTDLAVPTIHSDDEAALQGAADAGDDDFMLDAGESAAFFGRLKADRPRKAKRTAAAPLAAKAAWDFTEIRREQARKSHEPWATSMEQKLEQAKVVLRRGAPPAPMDTTADDAPASGDEADDDASDASDDDGDDASDDDGDDDATAAASAKPLSKRQKMLNKKTFQDLKLSAPLLKAVAELGYEHPTAIQDAAIPVALMGKDVLGSAQTGSGKTAAFVLPCLDRLFYRHRAAAATRVLIVLPTRELAAQCYAVAERLARFTDVRLALVVGGLSAAVQEAALRANPDVVVGTPGRIIDHLRNTPSFGLDAVEILVLDEADRLLEMGFSDELRQIVKACPRNRQTMLFSATMTDQVRDLAALSLEKPHRISVDPIRVVDTLAQEFVRVKAGHETDKEAMLLALCTRTFRRKVIVFFSTKKECHRARILFGLFSLRVAELHGNLTQNQRLEALDDFRDARVDFLLCTDVAARGLDIAGIDTVINFDTPRTVDTYIHRVGRTARAGRSGVACTLVEETGRKVMRQVMAKAKNGQAQIRNRVIAADTVLGIKEQIHSMERAISEILQLERAEREARLADMEATKAQNMVTHMDEIMSRPAKSWFQTNEEKKKVKERAKRLALGEDVEGDGSDGDTGDTGGKRGGRDKDGKRKRKTPKEREKEASVAEARTMGLAQKASKAKKRMERAGVVKSGRVERVDRGEDERPKRKRPAGQQDNPPAAKRPKPAALKGHKFKSKSKFKRRR